MINSIPHKIKAKNRSRRIDLRSFDPAVWEYSLGLEKTQDTARRHGISSAALTSRAKKLGIPLRRRGRKRALMPTKRHQRILDAIKHSTYQEVAERYGLTRQRVHQIATRWKNWAGKKDRSARAALPTSRKENVNKVISFRLTTPQFLVLKANLKQREFRGLRSPNDVARKIVNNFLLQPGAKS